MRGQVADGQLRFNDVFHVHCLLLASQAKGKKQQAYRDALAVFEVALKDGLGVREALSRVHGFVEALKSNRGLKKT